MARPSKYPHHTVQTILVPKTHPDVVARGLRGARAVADRHGSVGGKADTKARKNFIAFRQRDPARAVPGSYISFKTPSGVVVVKARMRPTRKNPAACGCAGPACTARANPARRRLAWWPAAL